MERKLECVPQLLRNFLYVSHLVDIESFSLHNRIYSSYYSLNRPVSIREYNVFLIVITKTHSIKGIPCFFSSRSLHLPYDDDTVMYLIVHI